VPSVRMSLTLHSPETITMFSLATRQLAPDVRQGLDIVATIKAEGLMVGGVQLELRKELDFDVVSETGLRQLNLLIKDRGLKVAAGVLATRYSLVEPDKIDQRVDAVKRCMEVLGKLRASQLICRLGKVPAEKEGRPYEKLFEIVTDLAGWGNRFGVSLCLSTSFQELDRTLEFVDSIKSGPVTIDFDPLSVLKAGRDVNETLRTALPFLGHATLQDAIREREGDYQSAPIGEGEVEWLMLTAVLQGAPTPVWKTIWVTSEDDPLKEVITGLQRLKPFLGFV